MLQSLWVYVGPAMTSSFLQPLRKIGRHASDSEMLAWSMHALSSHSTGLLPLEEPS